MTVSALRTSTRGAFPIVVVFFVGATFGLLGTAAHQATCVVGGVEAPGGAILGIAGIATLFVGLRVEFRHRIVPLSAAIGVVVTVGVFSLKSPGGSILVPNNTAGVVWSIAPAVLAALVVCAPRLSRAASA